MLNEILTISGKQGLFKLLTSGRGAIIVENIDESKKRLPVQGTDKVVSLGDISIFTDEAEMPLRLVFQAIEDKYGKDTQVDVELNKATNENVLSFFAEIIPNFDRDRVYASHVKKIVSWYNLLVKYGVNDFADPKQQAQEESAEQTEA